MGYEDNGKEWMCNGCENWFSEEKGDYPTHESEDLQHCLCKDCVGDWKEMMENHDKKRRNECLETVDQFIARRI